jgi:hypothetical protein
MFVDEGGLLKGLLRNDSATAIYQAAVANPDHQELSMSDARWLVGVAYSFLIARFGCSHCTDDARF